MNHANTLLGTIYKPTYTIAALKLLAGAELRCVSGGKRTITSTIELVGTQTSLL